MLTLNLQALCYGMPRQTLYNNVHLVCTVQTLIDVFAQLCICFICWSMLNFKEKVTIVQHESGVLMVRFSTNYSNSTNDDGINKYSGDDESTVAYGESLQKESTILDDLKRGDSLYH